MILDRLHAKSLAFLAADAAYRKALSGRSSDCDEALEFEPDTGAHQAPCYMTDCATEWCSGCLARDASIKAIRESRKLRNATLRALRRAYDKESTQ